MACFGPDRSYTCHCFSLVVRDGVSQPHTVGRIAILCVCCFVSFENHMLYPCKHSDVLLVPECICNDCIQFLQSATRD
jgi:hypothetical protein